ncbi:uncharacterized protein CDAR_476051 [Caerostris darwini]|uniref:LAGLIDADG homing endonuclease n=1 Tax=Caerostris darwini TaxID=1538125 RepID=A0AAV4PBS1_9ARAC|nr:uncharacterized protein CDAR_476051 [Caerostris darwini]
MPQENNNHHPNYFRSLEESSKRFQKLVKWTNNGKKTKKGTPVLHSSFKGFVLRVKHHVSPKMKLGTLTLKELDNFIVHMIDLIEKELSNLNKMNPKKTLSLEQMKTAVKLCLPANLADASDEFAKLAVRSYFEEVFR